MSSYRFKRRAFLSGLGGAIGLETLLRNIEAVAEGAPPPRRMLFAHWPGGTVHHQFKPVGTGTAYTTSRILSPFEAAGLREDMIVLYGTNMNVGSGMGGGAEAGTVMMATGAACPGTRANGGEQDDAAAGGPSFDRIFLRHVPELARPAGSVNVICDARVDSLETSTQCLSYSHDTRSIAAARGGTDGMLVEHVPLMPSLTPLGVYTTLFSGFAPGGMTDEEALRALRLQKSVLDSSLRELDRLRAIVPALERDKIDMHAASIRAVEMQLSNALNNPATAGCVVPEAPDAALEAKSGSRFDYANPKADQADDVRLAQLGSLFLSLIRAAFQCDIVRVATFQWCTSTNHVAFQGLYPANPAGAYMHHPLGSQITDRRGLLEGPPSERDADIVEFLTNVHTWFNQKLADALVEFKEADDPYGGKLLDSTIVPYMTEKSDMTDAWSPIPSLILGGRALGMQGGQYVAFDSVRPHNDVWMSIAQALLGTADPLGLLDQEVFVKTGVAPIAGLWVPPGT